MSVLEFWNKCFEVLLSYRLEEFPEVYISYLFTFQPGSNSSSSSFSVFNLIQCHFKSSVLFLLIHIVNIVMKSGSGYPKTSPKIQLFPIFLCHILAKLHVESRDMPELTEEWCSFGKAIPKFPKFFMTPPIKCATFHLKLDSFVILIPNATINLY